MSRSIKNIPIRKICPEEEAVNFAKHVRFLKLKDLLGGKGMSQSIHRHDFFFLLFIQKGSGNHRIDFVSYPIWDNTLFFMRPGQVHEIELKAGAEGYILEFSPRVFYIANERTPDMIRKLGRNNLFNLSVDSRKNIEFLFDKMGKELESGSIFYEDAFKNCLGLLLIEILRLESVESRTERSYQQERLDELCDLVDQNISTGKKVSDYAEMMNLSSFQLNNITKSILGKTCSALINEQIVLESKRQLLATSNQINEIAFAMGFEDVSYFSRFFKKHTGHTPTELRENFK
ncbi:transcriptional regulator (plasmid) [Fulvitalea axinellae]|uniref:Transcriptional regulator n=1 Tax=Fulvitalea axinellae TaxID=1182444 RepID=A0AAU9DB33_9BACT|nr:transcriptional regulator [Fulvitalea axinellae]